MTALRTLIAGLLLASMAGGCAHVRPELATICGSARRFAEAAQESAVTASRYESIARRAVYNAQVAYDSARCDLKDAETAGTVNGQFRKAVIRSKRELGEAKKLCESVCGYSRRALTDAAEAKGAAVRAGESSERRDAEASERAARSAAKRASGNCRKAGKIAEKLKARWLAFLKQDEMPEKGL